MPYKRGSQNLDVEVEKMQYWIEQTDLTLNGKNGNDGLLRRLNDEQAKKEQRDDDIDQAVGWLKWIGFTAIMSVVLSLLRAFKLIP